MPVSLLHQVCPHFGGASGLQVQVVGKLESGQGWGSSPIPLSPSTPVLFHGQRTNGRLHNNPFASFQPYTLCI